MRMDSRVWSFVIIAATCGGGLGMLILDWAQLRIAADVPCIHDPNAASAAVRNYIHDPNAASVAVRNYKHIVHLESLGVVVHDCIWGLISLKAAAHIFHKMAIVKTVQDVHVLGGDMCDQAYVGDSLDIDDGTVSIGFVNPVTDEHATLALRFYPHAAWRFDLDNAKNPDWDSRRLVEAHVTYSP